MTSGDPATLRFRDGAARVRLLCSDPVLVSVARELFPDYLDVAVPPSSTRPPGEPGGDPGDDPGDGSADGPVDDPVPWLEVSATLRDGGYRVLGPVDEPASHVDESGAISEIERRLAISLLRGRSASYHLHAAALGTEEGAVLALGESGSGKSTVAFAWLLSGRPVLADDVVTVSGQGTVEDFRRRVKVDVARVVAAGLNPSSTVAWRNDADECWIDPRTLGGWSRPMPPRAIVRVRFVHGERFSLVQATAHEGLAWMVEGHVDTGLPPDSAFPCLTSLAERVPSFDVVYGDAADAVERLTGLDR